MIRVTRRYRFSASHRLDARGLSAEENRALYGKCNNPHGHGHDYVIEVSVRGPVNEATGLAADVTALDRLMDCEVLRPFDHHDLNRDVPEFAFRVPTTENLALEVERRLRSKWDAAFPCEHPLLDRIRIRETKRNTIEIP